MTLVDNVYGYDDIPIYYSEAKSIGSGSNLLNDGLVETSTSNGAKEDIESEACKSEVDFLKICLRCSIGYFLDIAS